MTQERKLSRRQFLGLGCGALCVVALGSGCTSRQAQGGATTTCPFGYVNDRYPGKCHRYVDADGDGVCDYSESAEETALLEPLAPATGIESGTVDEESVVLAPDVPASDEQVLSVVVTTQVPAVIQVQAATRVPTSTPVPTATVVPTVTAAPARVRTLCPRGLVDDPYPGRCRRYIDRNNNGYCDLSQIA